MRDSLQLKHICWAWLTAFWVTGAWAAQTTFVGDITGIPPAALAISCLLSTIGGAAYTASKLADPSIIVQRVALEITKDLLASIVAGLLTFFICSWMGIASVLQAACITLAGYGGSRVLERYLNVGFSRIDELGGKPPGGAQ